MSELNKKVEWKILFKYFINYYRQSWQSIRVFNTAIENYITLHDKFIIFLMKVKYTIIFAMKLQLLRVKLEYPY